MALIIPVRGFSPIIGNDCFLAENATIVGEVTMGDNCSVWFNAIIRGDVNYIKIGDRVNVQDAVVIHCTYQKAAVNIGDDVSIGHSAIVHGCTIQNNSLIGMRAVVMDNAIVEENAIVAAGAVILENTIVESGSVYAGVPAKKVKEVDAELFKELNQRIAKNYLIYSGWYK